MNASPGPAPAYLSLVSNAQAKRPAAAIVLGSGMSWVADRLRPLAAIPFADIPGLPTTSIAGHAGSLVLGEWSGARVLVFCGRVHLYEGHPTRNVTQSAHIAHFLGCRVYLLTNAAGGIHPALGPGNLMAIRDHIEWTRPYCWRSPGPGGLGGARQTPYSDRLRKLLHVAASDRGEKLCEGLYAQVTGPCYETPAEIRALQACGADAVGMSTAREAEAAKGLGMEVAGLSLIANGAAWLSSGEINHQEVLATSAERGEAVADLIERFLPHLHV